MAIIPEIGDEMILFPGLTPELQLMLRNLGVNGSNIEVGDEVAIHPGRDFPMVTHGTTIPEVGDEVIVRPGVEFPLVSVRPWGCYRLNLYDMEYGPECENYPGYDKIHYWFESDRAVHYTRGSNDNPTVIIHTTPPEEDISGTHLKYYPYGGIRMAMSTDKVNWYYLFSLPSGVWIVCEPGKTVYTEMIPGVGDIPVPTGDYHYFRLDIYTSAAAIYHCCERTEILKMYICP